MGVVVAIESIENIERVCASVNLLDPMISIMIKVQHLKDLEKLKKFNIKSILDANEELASKLIDDISKSKLLASETMKLKYLNNYTNDNTKKSLELIKMEQTRLLDIISNSFNAVRESKNIMEIKVFYDSFNVLNEIIDNVINDLMQNSDLSNEEYNYINLLISNQSKLKYANQSLTKLEEDLATLDKTKEGHIFVNVIVEGLDTILLSLKDLALEFNEDDLNILKTITSKDSKNVEKIRAKRLTQESGFDQEGKVLLVSASNLAENIISNFSDISDIYEKLYLESKKV